MTISSLLFTCWFSVSGSFLQDRSSTLMACSHRRHGRNKAVLSCRVGGVWQWRPDKTVLFRRVGGLNKPLDSA